MQLRLHPADAVERWRSRRCAGSHAVPDPDWRRGALPRHWRAGDGRRVRRRCQAAGGAHREAVPPYRNIKSYEDLPAEDVSRIQHFFEHYKDLEKGKWVKVKGWKGVDAAHEEIVRSAERYAKGQA
ncbi:inorganic diphosphatase-like protein [Bordetella pertussis H934]|nr:inorganic diphosphatase-like protein [Bordetella pertussis H934]